MYVFWVSDFVTWHDSELANGVRNMLIRPRWSQTPQAAGRNREHGAEEPRGAKPVTAPATVSGERPR